MLHPRSASTSRYGSLSRVCLATVLIAAGAGPARAAFTAAGTMTAGRPEATATRLLDGRVLLVGGGFVQGPSLASAELYDPVTNSFSATGGMAAARTGHSATLLPDGTVLVVGGYDQQALTSAELYNPVTGRFTPVGSTARIRARHTATLLRDGTVVLIGGASSNDDSATAEIYHPATRTFSLAGRLIAGRFGHTATLLAGGRVLVTGGNTNTARTLGSAEIYDPATATFSPTGSMAIIRDRHTATGLADGTVLVTGGNGAAFAYASAETYDPTTGRFSATGSMTTIRAAHSATRLSDGSVLIVAGYGVGGGFSPETSAEIYQPASRTFAITGGLTTGRSYHTATLLADGRVLVAGGSGELSRALSSAELFTTDVQGLPAITLQPANQTVTLAHSTQFTAAASGAPLTYQWQLSADFGENWIDLSDDRPIYYGSPTYRFSGAGTPTLTVTSVGGWSALVSPYSGIASLHGNLFRAVVSNAAGSATTSAGRLKVQAVVSDFSGFGRTNDAVFRPSVGGWFIGSGGGGSHHYLEWGQPDDLPIAGDFDGDRVADYVVFRPSSGTWFIRYSAPGYLFACRCYAGVRTDIAQLGLPDDVPVAADFDGDGSTDVAVWRPSNGTWYIRYSSLGFAANPLTFQWGRAGDVPVAGDFDGDGRTDLSVWRPSNGTWYIRYSSLGYSVAGAGVIQWGLHGDVPVTADFDGDGTTDLSVYRPSLGGWFILYSTRSYSVAGSGFYQWGLPGDLPVWSDFDGDRKAELTVYRPSAGEWWIRYSTRNYDFAAHGLYRWGQPGDVVVK